MQSDANLRLAEEHGAFNKMLFSSLHSMTNNGDQSPDRLQYQALDDAFLIPITGGVKVCAPNNLRLMTPYVLLEQGDWFEDEIRFVRHLLEPGMNVIDIGANYGCYALSMAKCIGNHGKLWAFEPAGKTAAYLARGIAANNLENISLRRTALSSHAGTAQLNIEENAELNSLSENNSSAGGIPETVTLETLDQLHEIFSDVSIDFIKMDAEGEEVRILEGGEAFFADHSPLVMFELRHGDIVNEGLINKFSDYGYRTYTLIPGLDILIPFDPDTAVDAFCLNLFCCKRDRARKLKQRNLLTDEVWETRDNLPNTNAWRNHLKHFSYTEGLMPTWLKLSHSPPDARLYHAALDAWVNAFQATKPAKRYQQLSSAFFRLSSMLDEQTSLPRLFTLARIAADLGQRAAAVNILNRLIIQFGQSGAFPIHEPFLALSPVAESIHPNGKIANWALAQALAERERLQAFSSYFTAAESLPALETIEQLQYPDPEMHRRLHLIRQLQDHSKS